MPSGIQQYLSTHKHTLTNNAQELTPNRFKFNSDANRRRKLSVGAEV
jgi:hypothetical protein